MTLRRWAAAALLLALSLSACSDSSPATAPTTTAVTTTTSAPTTTLPPSTTPPTTTTTAPTTTTLGTTTTVDRLAEVEAILQELEERRLDALYREDEEAFRALFASPGFLDANLPLLGLVEFIDAPVMPGVEILEIVADREECIAVRAEVDNRPNFGPAALGTVTIVLAPRAEGDWGFAFEGTGWDCLGPNPLDGSS